MGKISVDTMVKVYDKHKNLKLAAKELGMVWQTLYWNLNKVGHPVTGDKERYGSNTDKMARYFEDLFKGLIPSAENNNQNQFQAKVDFKVGDYFVDIKSSTKKDGYKNNPKKKASFRWAFCVKVQEEVGADFMVCFCTSGYDCEDFGDVEKILLIPKEFYKNKQSISVSCRKSKWFDFEITEEDLVEFFNSLSDN